MKTNRHSRKSGNPDSIDPRVDPANADQLLTHFDRLIQTPESVQRLRRFILDLAVRGKLVEQDPEDEPATELLERIAKEKARLVKAGEDEFVEAVHRLQAALYQETA